MSNRKFPEFGYNPVTGGWNDSLAGNFLWSNVNVSEAVPDVMTPATWSMWWIFHYEVNPFEFPGQIPVCGNICGRPYFNISVLASVQQAIGRDPRRQLQGDLLGSLPADLEIPLIHYSLPGLLWKLLPGLVKARRAARQDWKNTPEFLARLPAWCRAMRLAVQDSPDCASLLRLWRELFRPEAQRACRMLRSATARLPGPATALRLKLISLAGEPAANAMLSNLAGPQGDLESLGPLLGLEQVREGRLSREAYLERYGHRGPHEMELSAPGPEEDPAWLEKQMAQFALGGRDAGALFARQAALSGAAWTDFEGRFPAEVHTTRRQLEIVAAAARNREAVRSEVTRLARLARCFLLRAGQLSGLGEDIFFLALDEVNRLLAGESSVRQRIPARRAEYRRQAALPAYPAILIGRFDPAAWAADPGRRSDFFDARQRRPAPAGTAITGFGGAGGIVEGRVRCLARPEDAGQLLPGEILVTTTTNVGWTLLFPRLTAIVTDVGAPLSHAAIVARELGIPAVVGCGNASLRLRTGDRVRVDGGRGLVEIIDPQG